MLAIDDVVAALDFDIACALLLNENDAGKLKEQDDDLIPDLMRQVTPELIPGKPFVTVVQT